MALGHDCTYVGNQVGTGKYKKMSDEEVERARKAYHTARKEAAADKMLYEEEPMETGTSSSSGRVGKEGAKICTPYS